jgi:hypothetical protein
MHLVLQIAGREGARLTLGIRYASIDANLDEPTRIRAAREIRRQSRSGSN